MPTAAVAQNIQNEDDQTWFGSLIGPFPLTKKKREEDTITYIYIQYIHIATVPSGRHLESMTRRSPLIG